jgi:hypothetical protein
VVESLNSGTKLDSALTRCVSLDKLLTHASVFSPLKWGGSGTNFLGGNRGWE